MDIRLLEYFLAVCEELHFTRAAERLGISQPTLSQQIKLLEQRVGTELFKRIGRKIYITEAGKILQTHAQKVFYELEQAEIEINELLGMQRGKLTIGCSGSHLLHSTILSFHKQYPDIELSIVDMTTEKTTEKILQNEFDLGVVFLPIDEPQLESITLFRSELMVVASNDHPLATKSSIMLKEIENERVFLLPKNYIIRKVIDAYCFRAGISLQPKVELSDMYSLIEIATLNNGITIFPKSYLTHLQNEQITTVPIVDHLPLKEIGVIFRKEANRAPLVRSFLQHLLKNYNKEYAE